MERKVRIAIFASGKGSNARAVVAYSKTHDAHFEVVAILSNKKNAGVLEFAVSDKIKHKSFNRSEFNDSEEILKFLLELKVDLVVLAGFLWLVPAYLINAFPKRIVNIHPALLPRYGGRGMYGMHIHEAVKMHADKESGMTIHFVNEIYDDGNIIFQAKCQLDESDTAEIIGKRVLRLEHHFYPQVINGLAGSLKPD